MSGTALPTAGRFRFVASDRTGRPWITLRSASWRPRNGDRFKVLQPLIDPSFSDHSHGFRPGRRAHDAVKAARAYVQMGKRVVVDVDLAKFFDRVNHDILIDRLQKRIDDAGVIRLVRAYLNAGIMDGGVEVQRHLGTPQGGPLSPLLANVLLDEVDKALEVRGYSFALGTDGAPSWPAPTTATSTSAANEQASG